MECTCPKPEAKLQTENQKPAQKNAIIMVHHVCMLGEHFINGTDFTRLMHLGAMGAANSAALANV